MRAVGRKLSEIAAFCIHNVDIVVAFSFQERTVAGKDDLSSVSGPAGINVIEITAANRQLSLIAAISIANPNAGFVLLMIRS